MNPKQFTKKHEKYAEVHYKEVDFSVGTEKSPLRRKVHYRVVHYIETFLQENVLNDHGARKKSLIARGPLKRGSTIKRFDCSTKRESVSV